MTITYDLASLDDDELAEWTIRHTLDQLQLPYSITRTEKDDQVQIRVEITGNLINIQ